MGVATESGRPSTHDTDTGGVFSDRILTVPNVLSILRLFAIPVFLWLMVVRHADGWAFIMMIAIGFTDFLDGKLARLLDQSTRLGALLDPFVDRVYLVTTLVAFVARGLIPWWLAVILIARDLVLTACLSVYKRRELPAPEVIYLGKAATFALMSALPWLLTGEMDWAGAGFGWAFGWALLIWGTALYVWTGVLYAGLAVAVARSTPPVPHRGS
ncbi:CDP-alcohol phosphatidyltransferase family protein [Nocardia sp. NPDC058666]|uniref:CDP-alcohol phosphatidyltransferase family protein n=1 Tax=unclassified Nocardia TaxID=2637762 RepID=UPI00364BBF13